MRIVRTLAGLICLGLGVHALESNGWANQVHLRASGGDPAIDCDGTEENFTCEDGPAGPCIDGGAKWDKTKALWVMKSQTTKTICINSANKCKKTTFAPMKDGCNAKNNPGSG